MKDTFNLKKFISSKQLLKEAEEDNKGVRLNTTTDSTKVTGAAPEETKKKFFPQKQSFYLLTPRQLKLLRDWSAGGKLNSPGAKMEKGYLYLNVNMIPDLEGKRGRGGSYNVRDEIKSSYGKTKAIEAMEVLKAINYAIRNSADTSISTDGSEYKRIDGKGSWNGYAIYAAPSKEETNEEITNINETKMADNFDLRAYMGSKRLLTENFEPTDEVNENADEDIDDSKYYKDDDDVELDDMSDLDDYEMPEDLAWEDDYMEESIGVDAIPLAVGAASAVGFAATLAKLVSSGVMMSLEDGSMGEKGKQFAASLKKLASKPVTENEESTDDLPNDKLWYGDNEEDINLDDMSDLDDFEIPEKLAWEDDY